MIYILLVEPDDVARETFVQMVEDCGHYAVGYSDVDSAFNAMRGVTFDLLATGLSARSASRPHFLIEARARQPGIRILIGQPHAYTTRAPPIADACLQVPFSLVELQVAIFAALDAVPMRRRRSDA